MIERLKSKFDGTLKWESVYDVIFSKYCSFDSHRDVIDPELCRKGPKLVLKVPMAIERWKSLVKCTLWGLFCLWNHSLNILGVLAQHSDVINQKLVWKRAQTRISCTNGYSGNFEKPSWNIYSKSLETLGFLVHRSLCSVEQIQENVVRVVIFFSLWR